MPVLAGSLNGTYRAQDIVISCQKLVHGANLADLGPIACDMTNAQIWRAFPWRWTLDDLTPIGLTDGVQDYDNPQADFLRLINARIVRLDVTPNMNTELVISQYYSPELVRKAGLDTMQGVSYLPITNQFRFDQSVQVPSGVTLQLQGQYQTTPTRITQQNITDTLIFPDLYMDCFLEGVLYFLYKLTDDQRAGGVQIDRDGRKTMNGQMGEFYNRLQDMLRSEDYGDGNQRFYPEEGLGGTRANNPGLFSF